MRGICNEHRGARFVFDNTDVSGPPEEWREAVAALIGQSEPPGRTTILVLAPRTGLQVPSPLDIWLAGLGAQPEELEAVGTIWRIPRGTRVETP